MDESFDKELSKRLEQYSEEPRSILWHSISARIETAEAESELQKRKRVGWMIILGYFLLGGLFYLGNLESGENLSVEKTEKQIESNHDLQSEVTLNPDDVIKGRHGKKSDVKELEDLPAKQFTERLRSEISNNNQIKEPAKDELFSENLSSNQRPDTLAAIETSVDSIAMLRKIKTPEVNKIEQQDEANSEKRKKRTWPSIYFTVMPTLGYQRIEPNSQDNLIVESIDRLSTFSTERLGIRAELGAEYAVGERFKIFGGLVYFQRHQAIGYTEKSLKGTTIIHGPNGEVMLQPEFNYEHKSFSYEVRNLGMQVGLAYQIAKRKFLQTLGTGVEFHVALNKMEETPEFTNSPSAYVFYNFYYRIQYPADTKLRAVFQPTLNYSFYIDQNSNAPFYVKPYGLGLNIGFTYNFN